MDLTPEDIRKLAKMTLANRPEDMTCEEWVHRVGEYVEATHAGASTPEKLRAVEAHAEACPECMDELEALKALMTRGAGGE